MCKSLELSLQCHRTHARIDTLVRVDSDKAQLALHQQKALQAIDVKAGQMLVDAPGNSPDGTIGALDDLSAWSTLRLTDPAAQ
jgi:hypothetical protein